MKIHPWSVPASWLTLGCVLALPSCQASGQGAEPSPANAPAAVSQAPSGEAGTHAARHVLLVVQHDASGFRIRHAQVVATALPRSRYPDALPWRAEVEDAAGKSLASIALPAGGELRGEFLGADGGMQAVHFQKQDFAFVLRVPLLEQAATIRFWQAGAAADSAAPAQSAKNAGDVELGVAPYLTDVK